MAFNILFGLPCTILQLCTVSLYTDNIRIMKAVPTKEQILNVCMMCKISRPEKKKAAEMEGKKNLWIEIKDCSVFDFFC